MVVPKSFPALCTPYVQVVHQPWKCTVHKSWKCLHRGSVQEVSKSCKKCFVSKSVSESVLHNSYVTTVSKKCPSWALSKLGPNLTHAQDTSYVLKWHGGVVVADSRQWSIHTIHYCSASNSLLRQETHSASNSLLRQET